MLFGLFPQVQCSDLSETVHVLKAVAFVTSKVTLKLNNYFCGQSLFEGESVP